MISVDQNSADKSVVIRLDQSGTAALVELLESFLAKDRNDHYHLVEFSPPKDIVERFEKPLSLESQVGAEGVSSVNTTLLTIVYRASTDRKL